MSVVYVGRTYRPRGGRRAKLQLCACLDCCRVCPTRAPLRAPPAREIFFNDDDVRRVPRRHRPSTHGRK